MPSRRLVYSEAGAQRLPTQGKNMNCMFFLFAHHEFSLSPPTTSGPVGRTHHPRSRRVSTTLHRIDHVDSAPNEGPARQRGLEPRTGGFGDRCSDQLSYCRTYARGGTGIAPVTLAGLLPSMQPDFRWMRALPAEAGLTDLIRIALDRVLLIRARARPGPTGVPEGTQRGGHGRGHSQHRSRRTGQPVNGFLEPPVIRADGT